MKDLEQYYFDRDIFCKAWHKVFTNEEIEDIECYCKRGKQTDDFILTRYDADDEYYIIHKPSGTIINWYKHLGRTNTCNNPNFGILDLVDFLELLKSDLNGG